MRCVPVVRIARLRGVLSRGGLYVLGAGSGACAFRQDSCGSASVYRLQIIPSKGPDGSFLEGCPWDAIDMVPLAEFEGKYGAMPY